MSLSLADEGDDAASIDSEDHLGPWPAFVDLFAATTLILLVFFVVIAYRYATEADETVKVKQLYAQLDSLQRRGGTFEVQQQGADVLLILEERVTFTTGQADLLEQARGTLRDVTALLQRDQFKGLVREVEILGHADRRGNPEENWQLSARRAVSVAQFLVDSLHENPCTIIASGRSAYFPRDPSVNPDTLNHAAREAAFARDRRVEILLHPSLAQGASARTGCMARP